MKYIQFYQRSAINPLEIIEACGDRSVVIVDGRLSNRNIGRIAEDECRKRGYAAWAVFQGESFTRSTQMCSPNFINDPKPIHNPWGLAYGVM